MTQIAKILATVDSAEKFYGVIPKELRQNIEFRISLHKFLATDKKAQQVYLNLCREYIPIFFSTTAWTLNPQQPAGKRNLPFILRPAQIPVVETLNRCINEGKDSGIEKSRKQGASEICCKLFTAKCLLEDKSNFILGSRVKNLVDNYGDNYTLFSKCDNVMECLPSWWKILCGYDPKNNRKDMLMSFPSTGSSIVGETTNESFSAGSRATSILLDEFGRVEQSVASAIEGSIHDVAESIIYSSTHWLGISHEFNRCLQKSSTTVVRLMWYDSPVEARGLYKTPEVGIVDLVDTDYWLTKYPELRNFAEVE